ncbi:capsid cement protein [Pantoea stewartii]|uniref:capsid cement protein n=1 Tax=Pantoea stewartii TaxID=66269 RepID=UPI0013903C51|nr:capsid cement protein [Pantoea stewartii]
MASNYQQDGTTLDYLNEGEETILAGDPVAVGDVVGVAHDHIASGNWGVLHMTGVFLLPKAAEEIRAGQTLYLADGKLTGSAQTADGEGETGTADPVAGKSWASAGAADEFVPVRLGF